MKSTDILLLREFTRDAYTEYRMAMTRYNMDSGDQKAKEEYFRVASRYYSLRDRLKQEEEMFLQRIGL